jgi:hypothetical protein
LVAPSLPASGSPSAPPDSSRKPQAIRLDVRSSYQRNSTPRSMMVASSSSPKAHVAPA